MYKKIALIICIFLFPMLGFSQNTKPQKLRGEILTINTESFIFKDSSGERVELSVPVDISVQEVYPVGIEAITPNSYVGTTAVPKANGQLVATEVHIFPESMRGTGEGHRAWDTEPGSTMTNATVQGMAVIGQNREMQLKYKDGEKLISIPPSAIIVAYKPADKGLIIAGAKAIVFVEVRGGHPTALRVIAGRNGFKPPM